jgi:hypothetical protein
LQACARASGAAVLAAVVDGVVDGVAAAGGGAPLVQSRRGPSLG